MEGAMTRNPFRGILESAFGSWQLFYLWQPATNDANN